MILSNYLAKIFFLYLSQYELCLHCFGSLWDTDTGGLPLVQVMLIFTGHSPEVRLPRQLGQWVRKPSSRQRLAHWPPAFIYHTIWSLTNIDFWKSFYVYQEPVKGGGTHTNGRGEQSKNSSGWQPELCAWENQIHEATEGHSICSLTASSLKCHTLW